MGLSALIGGLKNGAQHFSPKIAVSNAALLVLALIGLFVPAIFAFTTHDQTPGSITEESVLVAAVLIVAYVLSLIYQFSHPTELGSGGETEEHGGPAWTGRTAIVVLLGAAALLAVLSEILVSSIEPFIASFGLSFFFVGVVIIPTIGNLAEHLVSVQLAAKDKMEFALAVTFGSSLQIALFVAPVLVLLGAVMGQPMNLVFTPLEIAAVAAAVGISSLIAIDGETNWLEGALLTLVYAILAISFFEFVGPVGP
jgi:Ca2+:H+ antiporter